MKNTNNTNQNLTLRHTLATLAFRGAKALQNTPNNFGEARIAENTRSTVEILSHIGDLLEWASSMVIDQPNWEETPAGSLEEERVRFFSELTKLDTLLAENKTLPCCSNRLFQGPIADALTHIGQLATLSRISGDGVKHENYFQAHIEVGSVGEKQQWSDEEF